jgi:magnesium-transporting ATPase (P-type)
MWRDNTFSVFNLSLVGIAFVQLLLGRPLDALISLGVMILNISVNIAQELIARRRMKDILESRRVKSTVIRDGRVRSIDPGEIVPGDAYVLGPGDQIFVDGKILADGTIIVDESFLKGGKTREVKHSGDWVFAGGLCISGHAVTEVEQVGADRLIISLLKELPQTKEGLTPLEKIINRILKVLLLVVGIFTLIMLTIYFRWDLGIPEDAFMSAVSVIFSIAPAGLFFMIFLTYTAGTADIARIGALVPRARSVESLAQVSEMCIAKAGATSVEMEPVKMQDEKDTLAETRIRQILGDFARNTATQNLAISAIANVFEGTDRIVNEEAPFLSVYGWSALAFNDDDLRGVYVLGVPEILGPYLSTGKLEEGESKPGGPKQSVWGRLSGSVGGIFKRSPKSNPEKDVMPENEGSIVAEPSDKVPEQPDETSFLENSDSKPGFFKRTWGRVGRVFTKEKQSQDEESNRTEGENFQRTSFLFAYQPELFPLYDDDFVPQLDSNLIPLCRVLFSEQVNPEVVKTIHNFITTGVDIKIFSTATTEKSVALLLQAGLSEQGEGSVGVISGTELGDLEPEQFALAVDNNTFFDQISTEQSSRIVGALRRQGKYTAVLGDGVSDVPALRQANLAIVRQNSSQAALNESDIVLLEDSPAVLHKVLEKGQRILTGLLDILKLYLTQVSYLALLILSIVLFASGFPYKSTQGSVITVLTLTIPSLALTLWASPGIKHSDNFGRMLAHFVLPAAVTTSAAGVVVYSYFLEMFADVVYAQLAVTHTLVVTGLLLVIFVRPPIRLLAGGSKYSADWKPTLLVLFLLIAFWILTSIPLAERLLDVTRLNSFDDYLFILLVVSIWAVFLNILWRLWPLMLKKKTI